MSAVEREEILGMLLAEYRARTGHFGGALQRAVEKRGTTRIHDRRMPDGSCLACALINLVEEVEG